jgi:hypothetical protein
VIGNGDRELDGGVGEVAVGPRDANGRSARRAAANAPVTVAILAS